MVAVLARQMVVNGTTYPVGHRADTIGLREDRYQQLLNLNRIVDTDDPNAARRIPTELPTEPLFIADAAGVITGAKPVVPVPQEVVEPVAEPVSEPIQASPANEDGVTDLFGN